MEDPNGWACFPDKGDTPGNDPMCLEPTFQAWAAARMSKTKPDIKQVGFGYMLQGGSDASTTDPFPTEPGPEGWVASGPHVMMVSPDLASLAALPTDYKSGAPWVMWQGTPYAHLMIPTQ